MNRAWPPPGARLVSLEDCPPVYEVDFDHRAAPVVEVWPPGSRDYYRGQRIEFWVQNAPGSWLFTRGDVPNVMLTKRDLRRRSKDPKLFVISIEEYIVPLPDGRQPPPDVLRYLADRPLVVGP